jgi:YVTN family beta-propeller protein
MQDQKTRRPKLIALGLLLLANCGNGRSSVQSMPAPALQLPPIGSQTHWLALARPATKLHTPVGMIKTARWPKESVFSPDGRYLIATPIGDMHSLLQIWRLADMKLVHEIRLPASREITGAVEGVFTADGSEFWFSRMTTAEVYVISMKDFSIKHRFATGGVWSKVIEFSPDGSLALVSNWLSNDLSLIDTKTYRLIRRIPTWTKAPRGIAWTPDNQFVYVISFDSGEIIKMQRPDFRIIKRHVTGGANDRLRIDPAGKFLYIDNMVHSCVYVWDVASDRIVRTLRVGVNPNNVRLNHDASRLYVVCRGPNNPQSYLLPSPKNGEVFVFDVHNNYALIDRFEGGNQSVGLDLSRDGRLLVFSNLQDSTLHLYKVK